MRKLLKIVLLLVAAIEISIRLLGFTDNYSRFVKTAKNPGNEKAPGVRRILVLGSSFTVGVGAKPGESYPDFLQQNLNRDYPGRFQVVNGGVGNANTRYVLEHLDKNIEKYDPDLIVAMIGEPNRWNYYGYDRFLESKNSSVPLWLRLRSLFHYSAFFRLISLFQRPGSGPSSLATADPSAMFPEISKSEGKKLQLRWMAYAHSHPLRKLSKTQLKEAELVLKSAFYEREDKKSLALLVMDVLLALGKKEEFLDWLEQAIKFSPIDKRLGLVRIRRKVTKNFDQISNQDGNDFAKKLRIAVSKLGPETELEKELADWLINGAFPKRKVDSPVRAEAFLRQAILADPLAIFSYANLIKLLVSKNDLKGAVETEANALRRNPFDNSIDTVIIRRRLEGQFSEQHISALNEYKSLFPERKSIVETPSTAAILEWTESDLALICQKIRNHGIPLVLQTFPPLKFSGQPVETDKAVREVAAQHDLPLSDTYGELQKLFSRDTETNYYCTNVRPEDPHLNGLGYKAVASILLLTLEQQGFLDNIK